MPHLRQAGSYDRAPGYARRRRSAWRQSMPCWSRPSATCCRVRRGEAPASDRTRFVFQFVDELGARLDLDAGLAHGRFGGLDDFKMRLDVDAVIGGGLV